MQCDFDSLAQALPGDGSIQFWFARDLQEPLGYARWENFMTAIQHAIEFCETMGYTLNTIFVASRKWLSLEVEQKVGSMTSYSLATTIKNTT